MALKIKMPMIAFRRPFRAFFSRAALAGSKMVAITTDKRTSFATVESARPERGS
jgi:hypothetical protein